MAEKPEITKEFIEKDSKKAEELVQKKEHLFDNPFARFNLNLTGLNPPVQIKPKSGTPEDDKLPEPFETQKPSDRLEQELHTIHKLEDPATGQKLTALLINWDQFTRIPDGEKRRLLLYLPGYNTDIQNELELGRIKQLAAELGTPMMAINYPGIGSDKLTKEQRRAYKAGDGDRAVADAILRCIEELGATDIDTAGISNGAWANVAIAARAKDHGIEVHDVALMATPGLEEMSPVELMKREAEGGKTLPVYQSTGPYDPNVRLAAGLVNPVEGIKGLASFILTSPFHDRMYRYVRAMAAGNLAKNAREALATQKDLVFHVIHGTEDAVSTAEANNAFVEQMQREFPGEEVETTITYLDDGVEKEKPDSYIQNRVTQQIYPGDTHGFVENPQRYAAVVKSVLRRGTNTTTTR